MASLLGASTYNVRIRRGVPRNQMKEEHQLMSVFDIGYLKKNPKILMTSYMHVPYLLGSDAMSNLPLPPDPIIRL